MIPLRALLVDKGVLRDLLGGLNHGPSGKMGKDNRLVSGKVLTVVRQEVLAVARQRTATDNGFALFIRAVAIPVGPVHQLVFAVHTGLSLFLKFL